MKELNKEKFKKEVEDYVKVLFRKSIKEANDQQLFQAVSYAVKDFIVDQWMATQKKYEEQDVKSVYYLSMEFLTGRALGNIIINLKGNQAIKDAIEELGMDLDVIEDQEPDAALGNGGLGRLAACFLDSLSTLGYPAYGCGIRYKYGMFKQAIKDGYQVERPDDWLKHGNPFEIKRPEYAVEIKFGGYVAIHKDEATGRNKFVQENYQSVLAVPYDLPIVGYNNNVVNTLRIWDAEAIDTFNLDSFDKGDYQKAVEQQNLARTICEVLYPNDNHIAGKELRLKQQYFFVSASVQRAVKKYMEKHDDIRRIHEKVCFQLNDTHPTVTVAELMRILVDEYGLGWEEAWSITNKTCAYTNHTIMSEALEKWPLELFSRLLPRIYQIIEEINRRFILEIQRAYPNDYRKVEKMAIIYDGQVKMAHLAIAASFSVNGVARLHTEILKNQELKDFYLMMPEKFNNKTNGITFRRWLMHCNTELAGYITELIGDGWKKDAGGLEKLLQYKDDTTVLKRMLEIKDNNKKQLKKYLKDTQNIDIPEDSIFDIQVKRLHEYKRQQLNALYLIYKYKEIKSGKLPETPITMIFGAKAAPAYLIPACDISEQISLASKEASGTGNMKFMLNGAVTLGTMDGANVEINDLVGSENIYIFGKSSDEVINLYNTNGYSSRKIYEEDSLVKELVDFIISPELILAGDPGNLGRLFKEIVNKDWFMTLLDIKEYIAVKDKMMGDYSDRMGWAKKMLVNTAKAGFFSSDRTIAEYNNDIWKL